ncbi:hypothetical protein [Sphaerothrix gracilis]|uniref:hypothetical protein n=1 Tax=Sphaerothrix gracilis TaxID=3151835 RepID=UPI0031FD7611
MVLSLSEYQHLLSALEDEDLYQAMQAVRHETPLSRGAALLQQKTRLGHIGFTLVAGQCALALNRPKSLFTCNRGSRQ